MLGTPVFKAMSRSVIRASRRAQAISQQMMSTTTATPQDLEPPVLFESNLAMRTYTLNRPSKLNALNEPMLALLRPKIEEWSASDLCGMIVGEGVGRAFCAGGDIAKVVKDASNPETRSQAVDFFKREFEMDYIMASLQKPYIAILDGFTMGGGVGLAAHAQLRIATENTNFAMPETKIGYCPDVGGSYFMSRLDGETGTYLALTGGSVKGRHVFQLGFATHYVPSRRIPILLDRLSALEGAHPTVINSAVEEFTAELGPGEPPFPLTGQTRSALDYAFRHDKVEQIFEDLESLAGHTSTAVSEWAQKALKDLQFRSPTSLKVALKAIRKGKKMTLLEALNMELGIATAYCNGASPDFATGVEAVLGDNKSKERPHWSPSTLIEVSDEIVSRFFERSSPYLISVPELTIPEHLGRQGTGTHKPMKYALPTEEEIGIMVRGSHSAGGGTGITVEELVENFVRLRGGKAGVKEKIGEVAERRCDKTDNGGDGNFVWLKWRHQANRP